MTAAKIINLFAGPGAGKSTTASSLFSLMKGEGHKVELVTEYAKELTYEKSSVLGNQWLVTGEQDQRLRRVVGQVDWIITDSPLPLSLLYASEPFTAAWYREAVMGLWNTYDNLSFFITRSKEYQTYGRNQTAEEAKDIDKRALEFLKQSSTPFVKVTGNTHAASRIYISLFPDTA